MQTKTLVIEKHQAIIDQVNDFLEEHNPIALRDALFLSATDENTSDVGRAVMRQIYYFFLELKAAQSGDGVVSSSEYFFQITDKADRVKDALFFAATGPDTADDDKDQLINLYRFFKELRQACCNI